MPDTLSRIAGTGRRRTVLLALTAALIILAVLVLYAACNGPDPDATREVKELPGIPAISPSVVGGPRLASERPFTYADSAYGKCLMSNGVKDLPPISKPLELDTGDPKVAGAVEACKRLAPPSAPATAPT